MDGRKVMLFIVAICVIIALLTWIFGQKFIEQQDLNEIETEVVN